MTTKEKKLIELRLALSPTIKLSEELAKFVRNNIRDLEQRDFTNVNFYLIKINAANEMLLNDFQK